MDDALDWLDRYYQEKGDFKTAAIIQKRDKYWVGLAILMAKYKGDA